ncbi:glycoside hydrolase family 25 protein [Dysgonomonas sp. 520]|uniref:glycoside hydrolase family 25 protein n=1 Tax=Dysgonomonas sp. 520 TaxID=2302931 RepID=UPI0013D3ACE0|nr:GH25 family lysozyme [Dysgonomonas sp. 520]NDW09226.1 hypothetical protein [Dysgonomonas sp. 520]
MQKKQLKRIKKIAVVAAISFILIALAFFFLKKYQQKFNSFNNTDYSNKYFVKGIDLSHHNPIIDWGAAKNENIAFAYIKSTEGIGHLDRNYPYNYKLAKENNIKIGSYHFYTFGVSGYKQAQHFIKTAKCQSGDLIPAIDVEHSPSNVNSNDTAYMSLVKKELKILEKTLYEHYGMRPIIYTNKDCYKKYVKDLFPANPIWICDLHNEPSDKEIKNWIIWQFSHTGKILKIKENIDLNYFRYSFEELKKYTLP